MMPLSLAGPVGMQVPLPGPFTNAIQGGIVIWAVFVTIYLLRPYLRRNGKDGSVAHTDAVVLRELVIRMEGSLKLVDKSLEQQVVQQAATATALTGVAVVLTRMTDKLDGMPTKLDLSEGFSRQRSAFATDITIAQQNVLDEVRRLVRPAESRTREGD
jgi:hypothetical protein